MGQSCSVCGGKRHVTWRGSVGLDWRYSKGNRQLMLTALIPCLFCNKLGVNCTRGDMCPCRQYTDYEGRNLWVRRWPSLRAHFSAQVETDEEGSGDDASAPTAASRESASRT